MLDRPREWVFAITGLVLLAGSLLVAVAALVTWWSAVTGDGPAGMVAGTLLLAVAVACGSAGWLMLRAGYGERSAADPHAEGTAPD
jgi:hypothetical protein